MSTRKRDPLQLTFGITDWKKNLDKGIPTDVIYTDFVDAFGSVPHDLLLLKLRASGINTKHSHFQLDL